MTARESKWFKFVNHNSAAKRTGHDTSKPQSGSLRQNANLRSRQSLLTSRESWRIAVATRVLLIDDDPVLLGMMAQAFITAGYEVATAENGRKGLDALDVFAPDLVITDIVMPEMEGIGAIREIKRREAAPKIVAISGAGRLRTGDYLSWAAHLGADAVLAKPFRMSELVKLSGALISDQTNLTTHAKRIGA
jgi:CheY-like chemotaxis protein